MVKKERQYNVWVYASAYDTSGLSQKITDQIETEDENYNDRLGFWITVTARSDREAIQNVMKLMDELYDHYCILKGIPIDVKYSEFQILKINDKDVRIEPSITFSQNEFNVNKSDAKVIFNNIQKSRLDKNRFIRLAMEYYRKAKIAENVADKIINYFIALESLYSENKTEITYRFSNRLAIVLGRTNDSRTKIARDAIKLYGLRSRIVHGDSSSSKLEDIKKLDNWVRKSIISFIALSNHYENRNKILDVVDDAILDDSKRSVLKKQLNDNMFSKNITYKRGNVSGMMFSRFKVDTKPKQS